MSIEKTNPWTIETISSKNPNGTTNIQTNCILQMRAIRTWPAVILANKRKHKVIGRTITLINSTTDKKGTKYQGELDGRKEEINLNFNNWRRIPLNQHERAAPILKLKVVVMG